MINNKEIGDIVFSSGGISGSFNRCPVHIENGADGISRVAIFGEWSDHTSDRVPTQSLVADDNSV